MTGQRFVLLMPFVGCIFIIYRPLSLLWRLFKTYVYIIVLGSYVYISDQSILLNSIYRLTAPGCLSTVGRPGRTMGGRQEG